MKNGKWKIRLLYLPAKLYELSVRARIALYRNHLFETKKLGIPVISVGNLTLGGTGKTPCVAYLSGLLRDQGHSVAILSRGYKRESHGLVEVSDGIDILCTTREAGDEPYLLAKSCPGVRVVVDPDRFRAGRWLEEHSEVSVFILDDAYQHLRLFRDLNLLLIDATENLDQSKMIPFGRLREPLGGLSRADAVIVTRSDQTFDRVSLEKTISRYSRKGVPVFYAHHKMTNLRRLDKEQIISISTFVQRRVAAISGIARPEKFTTDLLKQGMRIAFRRDFPDHHRYSNQEFLEIVRLAVDAEADAIITTEKDAVNLPGELICQSTIPVYAAQIEFQCENERDLKSLILKVASVNHS